MTFVHPPPHPSLRVIARVGPEASSAWIPIRWNPSGSTAAERILRRALASVDRLRSWQIAERLTSGLGAPPSLSRYRIGGRNRYEVAYRSAVSGETIGIGRRTWVREPAGTWQQSSGPPLDTRQLMPWWTHGTGIRLLDIIKSNGRWVADLALSDIHSPAVEIPFWFRLRIDLRSLLPVRMRMITAAHFMDQRYFAFNAPMRITPPQAR